MSTKSKGKSTDLADALRQQNIDERKKDAPVEMGDWREYGSNPRPSKKPEKGKGKR